MRCKIARYINADAGSYGKTYVEKSLSYFEDADLDPFPRDLKGRTWEGVKKAVLESNRL